MIDSINNVVNNTTRLVEVSTEQKYLPGSCNIGIEERERTKTFGLMGAILSAGYPFIGYIFVLPVVLKLLVFFPVFIGIFCLWQYRKQFSAYFGLLGKYNFGNIGQSVNVEDQKFKDIDKKQSLRMIEITAVASLVYTILTTLLL